MPPPALPKSLKLSIRPWWKSWWFRMVVAIVAVPILAHIAERKHGEWAWRRYQEDAANRGIKLRIEDYVPPAVPDADNFALIPYFANAPATHGAAGKSGNPLELPKPRIKQPPLDETPLEAMTRIRDDMVAARWLREASEDPAADVLKGLQRFEPQMAEIRVGRSRPSARYPVNWEVGYAAKLEHTIPAMNAVKAFSVRARALLLLHRTEEALDDWRCIARIGRSFEKEPGLISALLRMTAFGAGSDVRRLRDAGSQRMEKCARA